MAEGEQEPGQAGSITIDELAALNDEITALVRAGVPLDRGLLQASGELPGGLKRVTQAIGERLKRGESLSQALEAESRVDATPLPGGGRGGRAVRQAVGGPGRAGAVRPRVLRGPVDDRRGALVPDRRPHPGLRALPGNRGRRHPPVPRHVRHAGTEGSAPPALARDARRAGAVLVAALAGAAPASACRLVAIGAGGVVPGHVVVGPQALSLDALHALRLRIGRLRGTSRRSCSTTGCLIPGP